MPCAEHLSKAKKIKSAPTPRRCATGAEGPDNFVPGAQTFSRLTDPLLFINIKSRLNLTMRGVEMKLARDIQSLSTFKRDTARFVKQLRKTKEPLVLTINGKAAVVVQDVESYQKLLEAKERMETIAGIRRGLESMKAGRGKTLEQFLADFTTQYGFNPETG